MDRYPSRGMVSGMYRLEANPEYASKEETSRRIKLKLRRLVAQYGSDEVVRRLRQATVDSQSEAMRAWLVLEAMGLEEVRQRQWS